MQKARTIFHVRLLIVYISQLHYITYCILTSFCALSCPSTIQIDLAKFFQSFILTVNAFHIRNKSTLMPVYHFHKPVFRPKMAVFRRAGMKEGGLPLPLTFQYLIFLILRACDLNLVMISSLASK